MTHRQRSSQGRVEHTLPGNEKSREKSKWKVSNAEIHPSLPSTPEFGEASRGSPAANATFGVLGRNKQRLLAGLYFISPYGLRHNHAGISTREEC